MLDTTQVIWASTGLVGAGILTGLTAKFIGRLWSRSIEPTLDRISTARRHRREVDEKLQRLVEEFEPNSGRSLADKVGQIDVRLQSNETKIDEMSSTLGQVLEHVTRPGPGPG